MYWTALGGTQDFQKAGIPGLENRKKQAQLEKQNFRQKHTQNQSEESSVAFACVCKAFLDKGILERLLLKLNLAVTVTDTKRNS